MDRLQRLWKIDLVRQFVIAFLLSAGVTGVVVGAAFALDTGSDPDAYDASASNEHRVDALNKVAVRNHATRQGRLSGRFEAERDLPSFIAEGSEAEGYELGYRWSWNAAVLGSVRVAILQRNAAADGTQWIELLR